MLFLILVIMPSIRNNPQRRQLLYAMGIRFRTVGWIALALLLITGISNMYFRGISLSEITANGYGRLFGYKICVFLLIIGISFYHDFFVGPKGVSEIENEASRKRFVKIAKIIGQLNLLLALIAAGIGIIIVRGV